MDIKALFGLRPKANTEADLAAAVKQAEAALSEVQHRMAELQRDRGARLLDDAPDLVEGAEREINDLRNEGEQLTAIVATLRDRREAAKRQESRAGIAVLVKDAQRQHDAFVTWWRDSYPQLARQMAEGLALEKAATDMAAQARNLIAIGRYEPTEFGHIPNPPVGTLWPKSTTAFSVAGQVQLPAVDGPADNAVFWPQPTEFHIPPARFPK